MDSVVPSTPALLVGWAVSIALLVASLIVVAAPRHGRTSFSRRAWLLAAGVYLSAFALKGSQYLAGLTTSSTPLLRYSVWRMGPGCGRRRSRAIA